YWLGSRLISSALRCGPESISEPSPGVRSSIPKVSEPRPDGSSAPHLRVVSRASQARAARSGGRSRSASGTPRRPRRGTLPVQPQGALCSLGTEVNAMWDGARGGRSWPVLAVVAVVMSAGVGNASGDDVPKVPFGNQPCQSLSAADQKALQFPETLAGRP